MSTTSMITAPDASAGRVRRVATALTLLAAITFGSVALASCSSDSKSDSSPAEKKKNATTLLNEAMQAHVQGDLAKAQKTYTEVIKADPQNKFAYYNLGLIFQSKNQAKEAEDQYNLALTIDPEYEPALYNLAILKETTGDTTKAIELYRKAIAANAKDANARYNLGLLLRKTGKTDEGNNEIQVAITIDPALKAKAEAANIPVKENP